MWYSNILSIWTLLRKQQIAFPSFRNWQLSGKFLTKFLNNNSIMHALYFSSSLLHLFLYTLYKHFSVSMSANLILIRWIKINFSKCKACSTPWRGGTIICNYQTKCKRIHQRYISPTAVALLHPRGRCPPPRHVRAAVCWNGIFYFYAVWWLMCRLRSAQDFLA